MLALVRRQGTHPGLGEQFSRNGRKMGVVADEAMRKPLRGIRRNRGQRDTQRATFPLSDLSRFNLAFILPKVGAVSTRKSESLSL